MKNNLPILLLACAVLWIVPLSLANPAPDQGHGEERVFHHPKVEVEKVIQELHATMNGRLPILDGFVDHADEQRDRFTRGYFECAVQVVANGQDETRVRVAAKITAWYTDSNPSQSGYRVLLSNGRVESDLLDRIEEALAAKGGVSAAPQSSRSNGSGRESPAHSSTISPMTGIRPDTSNLPAVDSSPLVRGKLSGASPKFTGSPVASVIASPNSSEDIESLKHRREDAEKQLSDLNGVVQNLEEILRSQTHPTDIAVVRKSGTRVMSKPRANLRGFSRLDSPFGFDFTGGAESGREQGRRRARTRVNFSSRSRRNEHIQGPLGAADWKDGQDYLDWSGVSAGKAGLCFGQAEFCEITSRHGVPGNLLARSGGRRCGYRFRFG